MSSRPYIYWHAPATSTTALAKFSKGQWDLLLWLTQAEYPTAFYWTRVGVEYQPQVARALAKVTHPSINYQALYIFNKLLTKHGTFWLFFEERPFPKRVRHSEEYYAKKEADFNKILDAI
jgi:hypothetical protein